MTVFKHLLRIHVSVFGIFWTIMAVILAGMMASFEIFGHWMADGDEHTSAWQLAGTQAPLWFVFVIGIMLATSRLPVAIANGVTRREFCVAAAMFGVVAAVVCALLTMAGFGVEYAIYNANGIMPELGGSYEPVTFATLGRSVLSYLSFILAGWIIGLCYYRISPWWATLLLPVTALPLAAGITLPYTDIVSDQLAASVVVVPVAAVAAYLMARSVPVRPKKA